MSENTEHHPEAPQATAESAGDELQTLIAELNQARAAIAEHDREVGSLKRQLVTEQERAHRELARAKAEATALTRRLEAQRAPLDRAAELSVQTVMASFPTPHDQPLTELLRTAEVTYQTALRSPVSPAALAMLYCSALERALEVALVHPFSQALDRDRMRATFLAANALHTKTKGARYHEHLLDMLDAHRPVRSVTLGSLRVLLGNLHLSRLGLLSRFLEKQLRGEPGFLAHLSRYLGELKGDLRDPAAHGAGHELRMGQLVALRATLLQEWNGEKTGLLAQLGRIAQVGAQLTRPRQPSSPPHSVPGARVQQ